MYTMYTICTNIACMYDVYTLHGSVYKELPIVFTDCIVTIAIVTDPQKRGQLTKTREAETGFSELLAILHGKWPGKWPSKAANRAKGGHALVIMNLSGYMGLSASRGIFNSQVIHWVPRVANKSAKRAGPRALSHPY